MKLLEIKPADAEQAGFFALSERVHANDPHFIPAGRAAAASMLHDPDFAGRQAVFMLERKGALQARCVARLGTSSDTGTIGFFEAIDAPDACRLLLSRAERWLYRQGIRRVLGPMDGDTWHAYRFATGLNTDSEAPFLKEPWNPPYYPMLWEACGYTLVDKYFSSRISDPARAADRLMPYRRRVERQGYTFRKINKNCLTRELDLMYSLAVRIFQQNPHFTAISRASFLRLYAGIRPLIQQGLCQFCCAPNGQEIGFVFGYPDYADAVRNMRGGRGPLAMLKFLRGRRLATRVCIKSLGCLPDYRGTGVGPALMALAFEQTSACGYDEALMCLMHEANDSRRLDGGASEPFRQYALYQKLLNLGELQQ